MQSRLSWEKDPAKHICTQSLIRRGLMLFTCITAISLQSLTGLMVKEILNSMPLISSKPKVMLASKEIDWWNNSCDPLKELHVTANIDLASESINS